MNPLTELETVLSAIAPQKRLKRRHGHSEMYQAFRPTVTIPGVRKWYPKLEEYAKTGEIRVGSVKSKVSCIYQEGKSIAIEAECDEFKFKLYRDIESDFQQRLIKSDWATLNGWQFRLIGGLKIPRVTYVDGKTIIELDIEMRKTGFFGRFTKAGITDITCDENGADVGISGLASWFVAPRLVWGD